MTVPTIRVTTAGTWAKFRHGRRHHYIAAHIRMIDTVVMACGYQTWADNAVSVADPAGLHQGEVCRACTHALEGI